MGSIRLSCEIRLLKSNQEIPMGVSLMRDLDKKVRNPENSLNDSGVQQGATSQKADVSIRAIVISIASVFVITVMLVNSKLFNLIPEFDTWSVPSELAVGVLLVLLIVNCILNSRRSRFTFSKGELASMYNMITAGTLVVTIGVFFYFVFELVAVQRLVVMGGAKEYVNYVESMSHLVIPKGDQVVRGFLLGRASVPWDAWLFPIIVWFVFFAAVYSVMCFLVTLVTRQFVDIEHLTFPLVTPVVELIAGSNRIEKSIWRNPVFWGGVICTTLIAASQALHRHYFPMIPEIPTYFPDIGRKFQEHGGFLGNAFSRFSLHVNPVAVGIGYFMSTTLSFNLWFFRLVYIVYKGIDAAYFGGSVEYAQDFGTEWVVGGFLGLSLYFLWISRYQIRQVFQGAFRPNDETRRLEEDSPLSYRFAVLGGVFGFLFLIVFSSVCLKINLWVAIAFFVIFFSGVLAMTKIRADAGIPLSRIHGVNYCYTLAAVAGRSNISDSTMIGLSYFQPLFYGSFGVLSPVLIESYKFGDMTQVRRRSLTYGISIVCALAFFFSFAVGLPAIYKYGVSMITQGRGWHYQWVGFNDVTRNVKTTLRFESMAIDKVIALVFGFALPVLLGYLRSMFVWFPFHPIGIVMGAHEFGIGVVLFFPWLVKTLLFRYGGLQRVRAAEPLFIGFVVGWIGTRMLFSLLGTVITIL
jgi:hypothetical protein